MNNWWGSASGPYSAAHNASGAGDVIDDPYNSTTFTPWLTQAPYLSATATPATSTDPCAGVEQCSSNVLFLPGIESSRLYRSNDQHLCDYSDEFGEIISPPECRLWEPGGDVLSQYLAFYSQGQSILSDIYTRDVLDKGYGNAEIYSSFLSQLNVMKNTSHLITDYSAAPYDWRYSITDILTHGTKDGVNISYTSSPSSDPYIMSELRRLVASSKTGKVTIVAHSNGGLVAKALLKKLEDAHDPLLEKVDKVIFVATPHLGTPQAIGALLHGFKQDIPDTWQLPNGIFISSAMSRMLAHDFPGAYSLLPSAKYFQDVRNPVATFANTPLFAKENASYGLAIGNATELHNFLINQEERDAPATMRDIKTPNALNGDMLLGAEAFHIDLDSWTPTSTIKVYEIAGWGVDTVSGIEYKEGKKNGSAVWDYDPILTEDGDGTVVVPSALAVPASVSNVKRYWVDIGTYNSAKQQLLDARFSTVDHSSIFGVESLRHFIQDIITNQSLDNLSAYQFISTTTPPINDTDKHLRYFLHSPLSLEVYDADGNHTGISTTTGLIDTQIPDAYYREFGEVKYITAPASATLHLVLNGQGAGSFSLEIQEVRGDTIIATTTFVDIPSSTSTKATMDFTDGSIINASPLRIDSNGDGTVDHTLVAVLGGEVTMPKPKLTVTAHNKTIILGNVIPSFSATISGFVDSDTVSSSVTGSPNCTTTATTTSIVGVYPVVCTVGTLVSAKYDFANFANGTLTIIYKWSGFTQPINDTTYNPTQNLSVFKGGSTIPVKFQLKNASGAPVQASSAPLWLTPQKLSSMSTPVDESMYSDLATSGTSYRYDATSQQYIYNWSTKGLATGYWYRIHAKLDDGTTESVVVGIR